MHLIPIIITIGDAFFKGTNDIKTKETRRVNYSNKNFEVGIQIEQ